MKLFFIPGACSLAPHMVLEELGLTYEAVRVHKDKTYNGGNFLDINKKGYVPTLCLENGEILTEVATICLYLADQRPDKNLVPKSGMDRYRCLEWLNFIATEMHKGFSPLWKDTTPDSYKAVVKEKLTAQFSFLSSHLKESVFLMNAYTVADAYLFTILNWANFLKWDISQWTVLM